MKKVTIVIPTYNSKELVLSAIERLKNRVENKIIVCDDASTDETVSSLKGRFGDEITVIAGNSNLGPGGNRNRVLDHPAAEDSILLFIDADCEFLYTGQIDELVTQVFRDQSVGVVGFGILDKQNQPMRWNFGALMHPVREASDQVLEEMLAAKDITVNQFMKWAPERAGSLRMLEDIEREVGWVAEGCFAIRGDIFKSINGFNESMRYHETHDLNARVAAGGLKTVWNPTVLVKHLEFDSRFHRRDEDERMGRLEYYRDNWGMSEEVFKRLFDE